MRPQCYNQASIDQAHHIHHSATSTKSATSTASGMSNTSGPGFTSMCVACVAAAAVMSTGECGSAVLRAALCGCTWHYSRPVRVQRVMCMQREGRIHVWRWGVRVRQRHIVGKKDAGRTAEREARFCRGLAMAWPL